MKKQSFELVSTYKVIMFSIMMLFIFNLGFSQENNKKAIKEKEKQEAQDATQSLMDIKTFTFVAQTANPSGGRSVNLTTNPNYLKVSPEMIDSSMPFFGRSTTSHYSGGSGGLDFKGKPENFKIEKKKKNYQVNFDVKDSNDHYRVNMSVSFEGSTTLTITSNNKSVMSYFGKVSKE